MFLKSDLWIRLVCIIQITTVVFFLLYSYAKSETIETMWIMLWTDKDNVVSPIGMFPDEKRCESAMNVLKLKNPNLTLKCVEYGRQ